MINRDLRTKKKRAINIVTEKVKASRNLTNKEVSDEMIARIILDSPDVIEYFKEMFTK